MIAFHPLAAAASCATIAWVAMLVYVHERTRRENKRRREQRRELGDDRDDVDVELAKRDA